MNKELQFLIYNTPHENIKVDVVVKDETIWLTQKAMAALFGVQVPAISKHLKNIYEEGELFENTTISKMETVVNRGFRGEVNEVIDFYNLDAIISVGYRVNSIKATAFRQWATKTLVENENTFTMQQFAQSVNEFLHFRKFKILTNKGKISKVQAEQKAAEEYDEFNKTQKIISDFDKEIKRLKGGEE